MLRVRLVVLMALLLITTYIIADDLTATAQSVEKPFILDPTYSVSQVIRPGAWFIVEVRDPSGVFTPGLATATLSCYISGLINISLKVNGYSSQAGRHSINFSVPGFELSAGEFYPCSLVVSDGRNLLVSEKSVYIYNKSLDRLGILHISDIHILLPTPIGTAYQTLTSAVFLANMLGDIDHVINTGDTIDRPGDAMLYTYYRQALKILLKPMLAVPGNHDGSGISPDVFSSVYGSNVGSITWFRRIGNYLIVGLDTSARGVIDSSQLVFLEKVLRENQDAKVKIVLMHHPIFRAGAKGLYIDQPLKDIPKDLLYSSWAGDENIAREFLRLVDIYNVSAVLAGHVHQDSIVIYRNKTIFIATGTLGGPRSDYNAFRIVDIYSNGTVAPRYAPGTSANSNMNSYNIKKAIIRYLVDRDYSGVFLNISRELGISFGESVSIYLDSPNSNSTIERILYDTQSKETIKPATKIEILGEGGAVRTIYRVDLPAQEIYRPQGIIVRSPSLETSLKPNIINIDVDPRQPRQGIDPIRVSVEVSRGSTYVYRVEVMLRASMRDGGSVDLWGEALPSWDYTRYTVVFKGINASKAMLLVRAYDLYGNTAEGEISITFREIQRTIISPPITPVTTITQPTVYITTQPAITTNTPATAITTVRGPTMPAETIIATSQPTSTYAQSAIGDSFELIVGIMIAVIGIALVVILFTRRRT